ncbi:MAG: hypothetical protein ACE5J9_07575 [Methanosarcinales archaeon]
MEPDRIIEIIQSTIAKKFGEDRIKKIEAFGPYEGEDLNVMIYIEGIDEEGKDTMEVWRELFDKLYDLGLDVPFRIVKA